MIVIGGTQKHQSVRSDGICPCLCSSMGTGGGYVPMIIEENEDRQSDDPGLDRKHTPSKSGC